MVDYSKWKDIEVNIAVKRICLYFGSLCVRLVTTKLFHHFFFVFVLVKIYKSFSTEEKV